MDLCIGYDCTMLQLIHGHRINLIELRNTLLHPPEMFQKEVLCGLLTVSSLPRFPLWCHDF
jgi:hypothetical protein